MIHISEAASDMIKEMLEAEGNPNLFLRLSVNEGGCSGFSYGLSFDDEQTDEDQTLTVSGIKVIVDQESMKYLYGVEIDYKESGLGGGFTIDNPNATVTCGCGNSFRTAAAAGKPGDC